MEKGFFEKTAIFIFFCLLLMTAYLFYLNTKTNNFNCNCEELRPVSEYMLEEYNSKRKMRWSLNEPLPDEVAGIRYASFLGMFGIGGKYTHGALEGGLKCTSFIDAMFRRSGRETPTRRLNSIYGTQNFYNLDGVEDYFEYVDEKDLRKEDIIIGYGNPGHIGLILDPKTKLNISTNHNTGLQIDDHYGVYIRYQFNEDTEEAIEMKPRFLRYKGCKC